MWIWRGVLVLAAIFSVIVTVFRIADIVCCGTVPPERTLVLWGIQDIAFNIGMTVYLGWFVWRG